ncbi:MAG: radical SAM protein [Elusimicrobia bacterium]|nr:radical SAM protein [Candidatus Liberimonas magnetica]
MVFHAKEIILSPTSQCNLNCAHCTVKRYKSPLNVKKTITFLKSCANYRIKKLTFSGGEPFLKPRFLFIAVKEAVKNGMLPVRIMTNGVWFNDAKELKGVLKKLFAVGFSGEFCISVDAFHLQDLEKLKSFIKTALKIFKRDDIVSIAYVSGSRDEKTRQKLLGLARMLGARLYNFSKGNAYMKGKSLFVKLIKIALSVVPGAKPLKNPWDGKWFKEDYCKGPGNVLFVHANGDVAPCCGYANEERLLKIGNIYKNSLKDVLKQAKNNAFVSTVFSKGLTTIRKKLIKTGFKLPGKTSDQCYFCRYLQNKLPKETLVKADVNGIKTTKKSRICLLNAISSG